MTAFIKKHSTPILFCILLILLVLAWRFPWAGLRLGIIFLLFSLVTGSLAVLEKHRQAYRHGKITRGVFVRNAVLAMTLAALLGRPLAALATEGIGNGVIRAIPG